MKRLTALLTLTVLIFLLAFSATPVRADTEIPDWNTVQWEDFSFKLLEDNAIEESLSAWLSTEADLHSLFQVEKYNTSVSLYALWTAITTHFLEDPENFIRTLASEDAETKGCVYSSVVYSLDCEPEDVIATLQRVSLSDSDPAQTHATFYDLVSFAEHAYEEEIVAQDWAYYDWENFDIKNVTDEEWDSMRDWFEAEAELSTVFFVSGRTDGAYSEGISIVLGTRFKEDPQTLIRALAKEDAETQDVVIDFIIYHGDYHPTEFAQFLSELTLPEDATDAEWALVSDMIQCAEENYNMDITNPKTGDLAEVVAALFVLSSGGIITTVFWKKEF